MPDSVVDLAAWGRDIFQRQQQPVVWASSVLAAAAQSLGKPDEIAEALALAESKDRWVNARGVFDRLRDRSLEQDRPLDAGQSALFRLAELVAKVAHNEAGPRPPFDHDSGWRVGPAAYRLAETVGDPDLRDRLRAALGSWPQNE
jgi:hypothetical protein